MAAGIARPMLEKAKLAETPGWARCACGPGNASAGAAGFLRSVAAELVKVPAHAPVTTAVDVQAFEMFDDQVNHRCWRVGRA